MNTTVIAPTRKLLKTETDEQIKVCAYCRVSTDDTDQRNSLKSQKKFFADIFKKHPNWTNVGIFADEGISGTSLEKRDRFNAMIALAKHKGIDVILTKEVSRFSRNATDLLSIVKDLQDRNVYIWFLSDDINTENPNSIQQLTETATSAQGESLRTSRRVVWGQQRQMEKGVVFGRKEMYGYRIEKDSEDIQHFVVVEDEAEIIKKIFEWFISGDGTTIIARRLENMGIKTLRYKNGWTNTVILRILRNEKYVGDLAQGKTYTPDPLTHKKKYNRGESYRYYITDHHPESAIIDRDTWNKAQVILDERKPSEEVRAKHSARYWTSGKVYCGLCGGRYVSYHKRQKNIPYKAWVCFENHQRGRYKETEQNGEIVATGCNGLRVNDRVLKMAMHDIITQLIIPHKQEICDSILKEINTAQKPKDNTKKIQTAKKKIEQKQAEIQTLTRKNLNGIIPDNAYKLTYTAIENEIEKLQLSIAKMEAEIDTEAPEAILYDRYFKQVEEIVNLSNEQINEELYGRIIKKIVVYPLSVLELHLSFMFAPVYLQYKTSGRGEQYNADFTILTSKQFEELKKTMPKNEKKV